MNDGIKDEEIPQLKGSVEGDFADEGLVVDNTNQMIVINLEKKFNFDKCKDYVKDTLASKIHDVQMSELGILMGVIGYNFPEENTYVKVLNYAEYIPGKNNDISDSLDTLCIIPSGAKVKSFILNILIDKTEEELSYLQMVI